MPEVKISALPAAGTLDGTEKFPVVQGGVTKAALSGTLVRPTHIVTPTGGAGTTASPWTGWEAAVNALPINASVIFPDGEYTQTTAILPKKRWTLKCLNRAGAHIVSAFTGSAIRMLSTVNGSTAVDFEVENLWLENTNASNVGAGIEEVAGTFVHIKGVTVSGFKYGIIFDQTELADIDLCNFGAQLAGGGGVWLANGNFTAGASGGFTNRISINRCQFNEPSGASGAYGIIDDGGYVHAFTDNNFNGCTNQIRMAGVIGGTVRGGEFESSTSACIYMGSTSHNGVGAPGAATACSVIAAAIIPGSGQSGIVLDAGSPVTVGGCFFSSTAAAIVVNSIGTFAAFGNTQASSGALVAGRAASHLELHNPFVSTVDMRVYGTKRIYFYSGDGSNFCSVYSPTDEGANSSPVSIVVGAGEALRLTNAGRVRAVIGDLETVVAGKGLLVKSPDGSITKRIGIDNAGNIVATNP